MGKRTKRRLFSMSSGSSSSGRSTSPTNLPYTSSGLLSTGSAPSALLLLVEAASTMAFLAASLLLERNVESSKSPPTDGLEGVLFMSTFSSWAATFLEGVVRLLAETADMVMTTVQRLGVGWWWRRM